MYGLRLDSLDNRYKRIVPHPSNQDLSMDVFRKQILGTLIERKLMLVALEAIEKTEFKGLDTEISIEGFYRDVSDNIYDSLITENRYDPKPHWSIKGLKSPEDIDDVSIFFGCPFVQYISNVYMINNDLNQVLFELDDESYERLNRKTMPLKEMISLVKSYYPDVLDYCDQNLIKSSIIYYADRYFKIKDDPNYDGGINPDNLVKMIHRATDKLDLNPLHWHDRYYYHNLKVISKVFGVDINKVSENMSTKLKNDNDQSISLEEFMSMSSPTDPRALDDDLLAQYLDDSSMSEIRDDISSLEDYDKAFEEHVRQTGEQHPFDPLPPEQNPLEDLSYYKDGIVTDIHGNDHKISDIVEQSTENNKADDIILESGNEVEDHRNSVNGVLYDESKHVIDESIASEMGLDKEPEISSNGSNGKNADIAATLRSTNNDKNDSEVSLNETDNSSNSDVNRDNLFKKAHNIRNKMLTGEKLSEEELKLMEEMEDLLKNGNNQSRIDFIDKFIHYMAINDTKEINSKREEIVNKMNHDLDLFYKSKPETPKQGNNGNIFTALSMFINYLINKPFGLNKDPVEKMIHKNAKTMLNKLNSLEKTSVFQKMNPNDFVTKKLKELNESNEKISNSLKIVKEIDCKKSYELDKNDITTLNTQKSIIASELEKANKAHNWLVDQLKSDVNKNITDVDRVLNVESLIKVKDSLKDYSKNSDELKKLNDNDLKKLGEEMSKMIKSLFSSIGSIFKFRSSKSTSPSL